MFVVFRGSVARASRFAARRAEPLFLLAGAVLQRVRCLSDQAQSRRQSSKIRIENASRSCCTGNTRFFRFQTCLGIDFGRFGVLPDDPGRSLWRSWAPLWTPWALSGRTEDSPRRSRDALQTFPRSVRDALGGPGRSESVPGTIWITFTWHCLALAGSIWLPTTAPTTATMKRLAKKTSSLSTQRASFMLLRCAVIVSPMPRI